MKDETFQACKWIYEQISKEPGFNPEKYFWEFGSKTLIQLLENNNKYFKEGSYEATTFFGIPVRINYICLNDIQIFKNITDDLQKKTNFKIYKVLKNDL